MKRLVLLVGLSLACPLFSQAAEMPKAQISSLSVDVKVGTGLKDHNIVGESDSFMVSTSPVVGWTMIKGAKEPTEIIHEWVKDGKLSSSVILPVRSSHYRTHSKKDVTPGSWTLRVKDGSGNVLGSKDFIVVTNLDLPRK